MRNRRYETVFILPSDSDEGKKKDILGRLDGVVEKGGGIRIKREDWGVRRLAYPVKNQPKGHYFLLDFVGTAPIVAELERHMRMLEDVYRFLTVKTDDRVDLEAAQKEQAEEKDKEAAKEAAAKEAAEKEAAAKEAAAKEAEERKAAAAQEALETEEAGLSEESTAEATDPKEVSTPETEPQEEVLAEVEEVPEGASGPDTEPQAEAEEEDRDEKKIEG
jgi:small subunit ribosomal protein S6